MSKRRTTIIRDHLHDLCEGINADDLLYKTILTCTCIVTLMEVLDTSNGVVVLIAMAMGICIGMVTKGVRRGKKRV